MIAQGGARTGQTGRLPARASARAAPTLFAQTPIGDPDDDDWGDEEEGDEDEEEEDDEEPMQLSPLPRPCQLPGSALRTNAGTGCA
jgi:hypothetical protein